MMNSKEFLQRYYYLDVLLEEQRKKGIIVSKEGFLKLCKRAEETTLEQIKEEVKATHKDNNLWLGQYIGLSCKSTDIDIFSLCADELHRSLDGFPFTEGTPHIEFWNKYKGKDSDLTKRTRTVMEHKWIIESMPPVIKNRGEQNLVMSGNHRVMAAIELGQEKMKVLLVCDQKDPACLNSLIPND